MTSQTSQTSKQFKPQLRLILVVPFVLQLLAAVGIVGYVSFRNGQEAVNDLAGQLRDELTARIRQELESYVETPFLITQINSITYAKGDLNLRGQEQAYLLWQQAKTYPATNLIYCGSEEDGAFFGVGRSPTNPEEPIQAIVSNPSTNYLLRYYSLDDTGQVGPNLSQGDRPYDPRVRPWYISAKDLGGPTWSEIYLDFDAMVPVITASQPVYSETTGDLIGVCATDFLLSVELDGFLRSLEVGQTGETFIIERSGLLISSSTSDEESLVLGEMDALERLPADQSQNLLVRSATTYLQNTFQDLNQIQGVQKLIFDVEGDRQYLQVAPFTDARGLDWLIVVVVPEADFMAQIHENTRNTILLTVGALVLAIALGAVTANRIATPIAQLNRASQSIASGNLDQQVPASSISELEGLSQSFNQMAHQLRDSFTALEAANTDLEQRVAQRTEELQQANIEISHLNEQLRAENIRLGAELNVARQLQQMILPKPEELEHIADLDIAGIMKPADEVGGDYYDVLYQEGRLKIGIGDVTGHGLESGVLMLMAQTAVRTLMTHQESDAVKFLNTLNRTLLDNAHRMDSGKSMTLSLLDYQDGQLRISGQHEEVLIVRQGGVIERIDTFDFGFPLGIENNIQPFIQEAQFTLHPEDIVVLYTDGITEATNTEKEFYGLDRLCDMISRHAHLSAHDVQTAVIQDVETFMGEAPLMDDLTLVVLKRRTPSASE